MKHTGLTIPYLKTSTVTYHITLNLLCAFPVFSETTQQHLKLTLTLERLIVTCTIICQIHTA